MLFFGWPTRAEALRLRRDVEGQLGDLGPLRLWPRLGLGLGLGLGRVARRRQPVVVQSTPIAVAHPQRLRLGEHFCPVHFHKFFAVRFIKLGKIGKRRHRRLWFRNGNSSIIVH